MKNLILILMFGLSYVLTGCEGPKTIGSSPGASGTPGGNGNKSYSWEWGNWGACSATQCGTNGTQLRQVVCRENSVTDVADSFCLTHVGAKPATSQTCSAAACQAQSCTLPWGGTIASGTSVTAYQASSVANGQTCVSQTRSCNNGVLSGTYTFQACTVQPPAAASCTLPWGGSIASGSSITAYQASSVPNGQTCVSQSRSCSNGTLSGSYTFATCTVQPPAGSTSCTLPWGGTIASGASVTAYASASVPNGQTCSSQTRSCSNGTLSGNYTFQACTVQPPVSGDAPVTITVIPSFETAGVYIHLPSGAANTVSAKLFVKKQSEAAFKEAHFFVRYDQNNMATSLFDLAGGTAYEIQVQYTDASGTKSKNAFFTTRTDSTALPAATRTVNVANASQLSSAISSAQPGDHIVLAAGTYSSISISKKGTAAAPIVIRGATDFDQMNPGSSSRAIIQASGADGVYFSGAAYVILDNVEVKGGSNSAVYLRNSSRITVQNSYIHDGGNYDVLISKGFEYSDPLQGGYYVIQNNNITDPDGIAGCPQGNDGCGKVTYYGVHINNKGGAGTVIRNNRVSGHVDNITPCGDEESARSSVGETTAHVLRMTNSAGQWYNHDTEVYGNEIYDSLDDDIETDGICVNLKVFKNVTGKVGTDKAYIPMNAITIAPVLPGPIFIVRNVIKNYEESAFKMNTAGSSNPTRNIFIYHNTIVKPISGYAIINLWYALPGDHDVPVKNIHFRNNILASTQSVTCTDAYNQGKDQPTFDYNLWYTKKTGTIFTWYNGGSKSASTIEQFRTVSGQETNGLFGNPNLDADFNLTSTSPAINKAGRLPGINDNFKGSAPDIGAIESNF